ncbi:MAG: hypothetical protein FJX59_00260 [Alphaproteobacteria bacterium]|nr:hypothetical protein [Alphaproteobacteria bacterium]
MLILADETDCAFDRVAHEGLAGVAPRSPAYFRNQLQHVDLGRKLFDVVVPTELRNRPGLQYTGELILSINPPLCS